MNTQSIECAMPAESAARARATKTDYSIRFKGYNPATWEVTFWDTNNTHTVTLRNGVWACDEACKSKVICRHCGAAQLEVERLKLAGGRDAERAAFILGEMSYSEFAPKVASVKSVDEAFGAKEMDASVMIKPSSARGEVYRGCVL